MARVPEYPSHGRTYRRRDGESAGGDAVWPEAQVTDNPVTNVLLGPSGEVLRQWRERPEVGYRKRDDDG